MLDTVLSIESSLTAVETQIAELITGAGNSSILTKESKISQSVLKEITRIRRILDTVKKLSKELVAADSRISGEIINLILNDFEATPGSLNPRLKKSTRKNVPYKEVVEFYTPLLNLLFSNIGRDPIEFQNLINRVLLPLTPLSEKLTSYPDSETTRLEIF